MVVLAKFLKSQDFRIIFKKYLGCIFLHVIPNLKKTTVCIDGPCNKSRIYHLYWLLIRIHRSESIKAFAEPSLRFQIWGGWFYLIILKDYVNRSGNALGIRICWCRLFRKGVVSYKPSPLRTSPTKLWIEKLKIFTYIFKLYFVKVR